MVPSEKRFIEINEIKSQNKEKLKEFEKNLILKQRKS